MSDSFPLHGLQQTRPSCSSPSPRVRPISCSLNCWCDPTPHPLLPSPFPFCLSQHQSFSSESVLHIRWPKYWSFSFSINPSNEYSGLISLRIYWFDLLAVQGILKSLLQHHSSKASILWQSASLWSCSHIHTQPLERQKLWLDGLCWKIDIFAF